VLGLLREGVQGALEAASDSEEVRARAGLLLRQARQLAGRGREALASLAALAELGPELAELQEELSHFAGREIERARAFIAKRGGRTRARFGARAAISRPKRGVKSRRRGGEAHPEAALPGAALPAQALVAAAPPGGARPLVAAAEAL